MKIQNKFKIDSIRLDTYKGNIITLIQFNSNSDAQISIMTSSEILDRVTVVSGGYKGMVLLALPVKIDCNNLHTLINSLKKTGYEIIIKSNFERTVFQYVFEANLKTEFNIKNIEFRCVNDFYNLSDKITFSFPISSQSIFDSTINFIKLIRPHTKAKFNLYIISLTNFIYYDLCKSALNVPSVNQLGITLDKYGY